MMRVNASRVGAFAYIRLTASSHGLKDVFDGVRSAMSKIRSSRDH